MWAVLILARGPGASGRYLALTGHRLDGADAIYAGFADHFVDEKHWQALKIEIAETGRPDQLTARAEVQLPSALQIHQELIDQHFAQADVAAICDALANLPSEFEQTALKQLQRASPLSAVCTLQIIDQLDSNSSVMAALELEYRFVHRSLAQSDFLEGIRAAVIDKDRSPRWRRWPAGHAGPAGGG